MFNRRICSLDEKVGYQLADKDNCRDFDYSSSRMDETEVPQVETRRLIKEVETKLANYLK